MIRIQGFKRIGAPLAAVAAAALLSACANNGMYGSPYNQYPQGSYPQGGYQQGAYSQLGQVTNVELVRGGQSQGLTGTIIGGAVGGLAGHQVGGGRGRTAATIVGAVGGALVGRALEQNMTGANAADHYRVTVRLDDGSVRQFNYAQAPNVQIGDRVRAEGNQLYR